MGISNFDLRALFDALDSARGERSLNWTALTPEINDLFKDVPCHPIASFTVASAR